ncbi:zinc metalloprotease TldD [Metallosphaera cuprina]|uniref:Peptidase U62, modulator of DNA gyrase n=1 Tax=Metallosphaera cuprina (strain Ar-4) TaxID=1006006 RepID=F4FZ80_METCR|nr:zinc metalloprotease TldD [Metallosphaera cuprina]AEB94389.1 peptidase U62, modulator of DNA gyrase [Metallosphaera cuprina Ar-4]
MHELLKRAENFGVTFSDLRLYDVEELSLMVSETQRQITSTGRDSGGSLRVLVSGNWGYVHFTEIESELVKQAVDSAYGDERINIVMLPAIHDQVIIKPKVPVTKSPEEIMKDAVKLKDEIINISHSIKSVNVRFTRSKIRKDYFSSEEREISLDYELTGISVRAVAREGDVIASASTSLATYLGDPFEVFDTREIVETIKRRIDGQLKGRPPKGGDYNVVLAPDVVGVFSHEAVGHLSEADLAVNGILSNVKGKKVAPEYVSIIDSGFSDNPMAHGILPYDDDGVESRDVKIVDKGVIGEFLVDRYYAAYLGERPTGNARAEDFRSTILIRMRNTYMLPGEMSKDELIEEIKDGYLMVSPLGGQTSPDGTFQFGIQEGYRIERGEIKESLRNVGISGYTIETLGKINGVSKDFGMWPGYCGKGGQSVPVGTGGPYISVRVKVGGHE